MSDPQKPTSDATKTSEMDELAKIDALISQHTVSDVVEGQQMRFSGGRSAPSGSYRCHRCGETGHFIQDCPQGGSSDKNSGAVKTRQARGIPKTFLESITEAEAAKRGVGAFMSAEGELVVMKAAGTEERLRLVGPSIDIALQRIFGATAWTEAKQALLCYVCQEIAKDPVSVTCCGELFCRSCILKHLDQSLTAVTDFSKLTSTRTCPQCDKPGLNTHEDILTDRTISSLLASFSGAGTGVSTVETRVNRDLPSKRPKVGSGMRIDMDESLNAEAVSGNLNAAATGRGISRNCILVPGSNRNPFFEVGAPLLTEDEFSKWKNLYKDALIRSGLELVLIKRHGNSY